MHRPSPPPSAWRTLTALAIPLLTGCASLVPIDHIVDGRVASGSIVAVQGHVSLAFEGQSIHASREACEAGDRARALWVDIPRQRIPLGWQDCAFAEVSGVFRADDTGHFDGWPSGAIRAISHLRALDQARGERP